MPMGTKAEFAAMFAARDEFAVCVGSESGMDGRRTTRGRSSRFHFKADSKSLSSTAAFNTRTGLRPVGQPGAAVPTQPGYVAPDAIC